MVQSSNTSTCTSPGVEDSSTPGVIDSDVPPTSANSILRHHTKHSQDIVRILPVDDTELPTNTDTGDLSLPNMVPNTDDSSRDDTARDVKRQRRRMHVFIDNGDDVELESSRSGSLTKRTKAWVDNSVDLSNDTDCNKTGVCDDTDSIDGTEGERAAIDLSDSRTQGIYRYTCNHYNDLLPCICPLTKLAKTSIPFIN